MDNYNGVVTQLNPDILECEVKQALRSITMNKASGGDGIPAELFQILKDDAVKLLHSICKQIWKTQQWPQDWKRSVFILISKKGNAKECSNYLTLWSFHMLARCSKSFNQATMVCKQRISRYSCWIQKRQRNKRSNCQLPLDYRKSKGIPEKHLLLLY